MHGSQSEILGSPMVCEGQTRMLFDRLGRDLLMWATTSIEDHGAFDLALSGGSTPRALFRHIVKDEALTNFPWKEVRIWQVDERAVAPSDPRSNWSMIDETLCEPLRLSRKQLFPMPVQDPEGAVRYEETLVDRTGGKLDYALLGLGQDGHTASLFPGSPALKETRRLVVFNDGNRVAEPRPRMTLTFRALTGARGRGVLVTGSEKREILSRLKATTNLVEVEELPIVGVAGPALTWYVDGPALTGLD